VQGETAVEVTLEDGRGDTETRRAVGEDVPAVVRAALARAEADGRRVLAVNTVRPTLEDAFVQLTGISADVMRADRPGR
jgi:5-carboxymethyl-2-hydroxymuconate isomerase